MAGFSRDYAQKNEKEIGGRSLTSMSAIWTQIPAINEKNPESSRLGIQLGAGFFLQSADPKVSPGPGIAAMKRVDVKVLGLTWLFDLLSGNKKTGQDRHLSSEKNQRVADNLKKSLNDESSAKDSSSNISTASSAR